MDKETFPAFGNNIEIKPDLKNKIIGDSSKYYLFGTVVGIGDDVKKIKVGDRIGYNLWGISEIQHMDGSKQFYIQENADFILGHQKHES